MTYISQSIHVVRVCYNVSDFSKRNKCLTANLLKPGFRYHILNKAFLSHFAGVQILYFKHDVSLKSLLQQ